MKIRSFIAADLNTEVKDKLRELQKECISHGISANWVDPGSIHLTLAFLGTIEEKVLEELSPSLEQAAKEIEGTACQVIGLGVFPSAKRPRVIWAGLKEGNIESGSKLQQLQSRVADAVISHGIELEKRPFKPHLTLARVKKHQPVNIRMIGDQLEKNKDKDFGTFEIKEFYLYRSDLRRTGAIHTKLKTFKLI
jgi:2'-5' RNA ligase